MADYPYPDPIVQVTDVQELARDLVVIPNRRVPLVPNIGVIGGTHSVLVIETGIGPRNVGEPGAGLSGAVGQSPHGERGRSSGCGDPCASAVSVLEQGSRLTVERGSRGRKRNSGGRAMHQEGADIGLELPDGPAQRWLGHVQAGGGPPEVALLGERHEVAKRAQVHCQQRYPGPRRRVPASRPEARPIAPWGACR
jgi:hypothetical protein